jgi:hypothetical protein
LHEVLRRPIEPTTDSGQYTVTRAQGRGHGVAEGRLPTIPIILGTGHGP